MKILKLSTKQKALALSGSTLMVSGAFADVAADAVTEITKLTTAVGTISPAILAVVGAIAVVGIVIMLMKKS